MNIPLDDLTPTSDSAFVPVNSGEFFNSGNPFWEQADVHKWGGDSSFREGYESCMFETALKSGKAFLMILYYAQPDKCEARAKAYNRTIKTRFITTLSATQIICSGHDGIDNRPTIWGESALNNQKILEIALNVYMTAIGAIHRQQDIQNIDVKNITEILMKWKTEDVRFNNIVRELICAALDQTCQNI